tara:strand:+ start:327 stop:713 length:387 start_codon:yes stop_codon:yes gene_type:complete
VIESVYALGKINMDIGVYSLKDISNEQISLFIKNKDSFVIEDIARLNFNEATKTVEKLIESAGLKCRVYTKGRSALMATAITPAAVVGWASAIGIGAHNVVTWNPDYEIAKNMATGSLSVTYKKEDKE